MTNSSSPESPVADFLATYDPDKMGSEDEVRTKFIIPLLSLIGYEELFRAEDFPIYWNEGRKKTNQKKRT